MADLIATIVRPNEVRVRRVLHPDHGDLIVTTIEVDTPEGGAAIEIAYEPDGIMACVVAVLNGLGFPQSDLEYLAERFTKDFR